MHTVMVLPAIVAPGVPISGQEGPSATRFCMGMLKCRGAADAGSCSVIDAQVMPELSMLVCMLGALSILATCWRLG